MLRAITLWVKANNPTCARAVSALGALSKVIPAHVAYAVRDVTEPHDYPVTYVPQLTFTLQNLVVHRLIGLENLTIESVLATLSKLET